MRSIIIEQARSSRTRADFYRNLARTLINSPVAADLERSARMLDERVRELECYAEDCAECTDHGSKICPMTVESRNSRPPRKRKPGCEPDVVVFNALAKCNRLERGNT